jgi:hypothetical protein
MTFKGSKVGKNFVPSFVRQFSVLAEHVLYFASIQVEKLLR